MNENKPNAADEALAAFDEEVPIRAEDQLAKDEKLAREIEAADQEVLIQGDEPDIENASFGLRR